MATISAGADGAIEDWLSRTAAPLSSVLPQSDIMMLKQMKRLMNSLEITSQMVPSPAATPSRTTHSLPTLRIHRTILRIYCHTASHCEWWV